jgi:hypothetical protein
VASLLKIQKFAFKLSPTVVAECLVYIAMMLSVIGALKVVRLLHGPLSLTRAVTISISVSAVFVIAGNLLRFVVWIIGLIRTSRLRKRIDQQIQKRISSGERDFSRVASLVKEQNSFGPKDQAIDGLVRERLQRYLENESEIQREAEDEIMRFLEPMPRHAKRLLNRLRLLLFVAHERHMFGGEPRLSARHIGKWAVLGERWPELLNVLRARPDLMKWLEKSEADHKACIRDNVAVYVDDEELSRFCLSEKGVKLTPVLERIIEFTPSIVHVRGPQ